MLFHLPGMPTPRPSAVSPALCSVWGALRTAPSNLYTLSLRIAFSVKSFQAVLVNTLHNTPFDTFILSYFIFLTLPFHVLTLQLPYCMVSSVLSIICASCSPLTCKFVGGRNCVCLDRCCVPSTGDSDWHSFGSLHIRGTDEWSS